MQQLENYERFTGEGERSTELISPDDPRSAVIFIDPQRMWGAACIAGTRVPVKSLFDHLASGISLDAVLDDFEGVSREKCVAAIEMAFESLMAGLPKGSPHPQPPFQSPTRSPFPQAGEGSQCARAIALTPALSQVWERESMRLFRPPDG